MHLWHVTTLLAVIAGLIAIGLVLSGKRSAGWKLAAATCVLAAISLLVLPAGDDGVLNVDTDFRVNEEGPASIARAVDSEVSSIPVTALTSTQGPPPVREDDDEFVGAEACRQCHADQHDSWHASYHSRMTQVVGPETVVAPFDDIQRVSRQRPVTFSRQGDRFYATMVDPDWESAQRDLYGYQIDYRQAPLVRKEVVMSTGSHHFQTYWVNGQDGTRLWQVPWAYHLPTQQWMPAEDAFIAPPNTPPRLTTWNGNCIQCHVTSGHPGLNPQTGEFQSSVGDYGISCEVCHGPGRRHVKMQNQLAAADSTLTEPSDLDQEIVNPSKLDHRASSQVCGQCHSYFSFGDPEFWETGFKYRAGQDLHESRYVHSFSDEYVQQRPDLRQGYWADGTMRLAGREFAAMDDSACYLKGEMSCLSCHAMHEYEDASDQLAPLMNSDEACLQCHDSYRNDLAAHTHHAPQSAGSRCYNCHMPHTSFGLLKAIRSHRIDVPTARMTAEHGRPNACNLCHVDQTLQWTAEHLQDWYQQEMIPLSEQDKTVSSMLLMLLKGDAVQRAVAAWSFGSDNAREHATHWPPAFLSFLMADPYVAVRFTAVESLKKYPGFQDVPFDFLGTSQERAAFMQQSAQRWLSELHPPEEGDGQSVLLNPDGSLRLGEIQMLMKSRDDTPIVLPE